jgi:anti-sigma regulatory factor (Ser/Thr protein kinase)
LSHRVDNEFRHEAFFYSGSDAFLAGTVPFVRGAAEAEEPILVAVPEPRLRALKAHLDVDAASVHFVDMEAMGRNPACIIPAWRDFVTEWGGRGRPLRGIGEPIWHGRSEAELVECQRHESLLNLAFAGTEDFWLRCPYDTTALGADVIIEAERSHHAIVEEALTRQSERYVDPAIAAGPFDGELPPPSRPPAEILFRSDSLRSLRHAVAEEATAAGLGVERTTDLVLAVNEVATNSVLHGGGAGRLQMWREGDAILCEVRDSGRLEDPLVGRSRPAVERSEGRGLWLVNQLCDLVQLRSSPEGSTVRIHMKTASMR